MNCMEPFSPPPPPDLLGLSGHPWLRMAAESAQAFGDGLVSVTCSTNPSIQQQMQAWLSKIRI